MTFVSEVGGRLLALLAIALFASALGGCYPHGPNDCKPNDTSCWGCERTGNTNPACYPPLTDSTRTDGGSR